MTEDPSDGTVYVSSTTAVNSYLYTLDVTTATVTFIGEVTNSAILIDVAASLTGDLYGFDIGNDSLMAIDKVSGAGTVIGAVGLDASFAQGMDFDNSTNTLYIAAYIGGGENEVLQVDLTTGVGTSVGSVNPDFGGAEIDSFAIAAVTESCYFDEDIPWMTMSSTSGSIVNVGSEDVTVNFDATGLADGVYTANICVFTNDPDESLIKVPVTLTVTGDLIFASGFESLAR